MKDGTEYRKYILDMLDSYANALTGFMTVQALIFCYALGNANILQEFKTLAPLRYAIAGMMSAVLLAVVLVILHLRRLAVRIVGEESCMGPILWAFWIRIGAVVLYGILPVVLLLVLF